MSEPRKPGAKVTAPPPAPKELSAEEKIARKKADLERKHEELMGNIQRLSQALAQMNEEKLRLEGAYRELSSI